MTDLGVTESVVEQAALATYTESGGTGRTAINQEEAVAVMLEKYEICCGLFHGFNWSKWVSARPQERLGILPPAQEHILAQESGKDRLAGTVRELSQAFALSLWRHAPARRTPLLYPPSMGPRGGLPGGTNSGASSGASSVSVSGILSRFRSYSPGSKNPASTSSLLVLSGTCATIGKGT